MELEELLDTQLQHVGVKGMKWGVRKSRTSKDRASETTPKPKSTVRKDIDSNKREVGMRKMLKDIGGLPDSEIQRRVNRVRNENDLRRAIDDTTFLDRKRKKALRNEYLDRKNLSDDELQKRVRRVKLEDNLRREMGSYKVAKDVATLPDAEVIRRTNRVRNENDFRRAIDNTAFVNNKRRKQLREEYFNREKLSDAELQERVRRLNLEDNLRREVVRASKPQREAANELIKSVSTQAIGMYTDPTTKIFTATGNVAADMVIKEGLKYTKSNKIVPEKYGKK